MKRAGATVGRSERGLRPRNPAMGGSRGAPEGEARCSEAPVLNSERVNESPRGTVACSSAGSPARNRMGDARRGPPGPPSMFSGALHHGGGEALDVVAGLTAAMVEGA